MNYGDKVAFKVAILFGLQEYLKHHLSQNADMMTYASNIAWGSETFGQDDADNGVISFIEPPKPVEIPAPPQDSYVQTYQWAVFMQGIMADDPYGQPTRPAYELAAELKRILYSLIPVDKRNGMSVVNNILNLGPKAQASRGFRCNVSELKIGSETVRGPGDHSAYTFFWLPVYFTITEDLENPRTTIQNPLL